MTKRKSLFNDRIYEALAHPAEMDQFNELNDALVQIYQDEKLAASIDRSGQQIIFFESEPYDGCHLILGPKNDRNWMNVRAPATYDYPGDSLTCGPTTYGVCLDSGRLQIDPRGRGGEDRLFYSKRSHIPFIRGSLGEEIIYKWARPRDQKTGAHALRSLEAAIERIIKIPTHRHIKR